ncbi:MAG: lytic transglycosylase domain-containing protein [Pseudomonadota bacterium]
MFDMMKRVLLILSLFLASPALAQTEAENGALLSRALEATRSSDWDRAALLADRIADPSAALLVEWSRLRAGDGPFDAYQRFLSDHGDWPGLKLLRRKGEEKIPPFYRATEVIAYFEKQPPQTGTGSLRLAEALQTLGQPQAAQTEIARAWSDLSLTQVEERSIAAAYPNVVRNFHRTRLNNLLWRGRLSEAERMLSRVDDGYRKLAEARMGLQREQAGVDALIGAVPAAWQDHPGLRYDRFQWRIDKGRWDEAQAFLVETARAGADLGQPDRWSNRRRGFARRAMREGSFQDAYLIATQHGLTEGSHYADLEWIAGYIALEKLNQPSLAIGHFSRFNLAVASPISKGRAGYWLGRTYEALGQSDQAEQFFREGARHQTSYYGQLAAERVGVASDPSLKGRGDNTPDWRRAAFVKRDVVQAGILLSYADEPVLMRRFFAHLAETLPEVEIAQLADLALELDQPFVALGVAKQAALRGIVLPRPYFPVTDLARASGSLPPEVVMAIARRESELRVDAASPAGALGLMQLMPGTAREVSRDLGVAYSKGKLTTDWRYNAALGSTYLAEMLRRYDGSYLLAFVAYNAGPGRADQWIQTYGDPRSPNVDAVDWVEKIPFRETRNYVMRVTESLHVYRSRLGNTAPPWQISQDLKEGIGAF